MKFGPKAIDELKSIGIDALNECFASIEKIAHGLVAMVLGDVCAHPLPESLNGVEIRAVAWEGDESKAQLGGGCLNNFGSMAGCAIPDNDDRTSDRSQPLGEMPEKLDGIVTVAASFVPDETLTLREVVGTIPVNPVP